MAHGMIDAMSDEDNDPEVRSIVPFLAAAVVIALVVIGIVVAELVSPAADNTTDADLIGASAQNFVAASKDGDIGQVSCAGFAAERSPLAGVDGAPDVTRIENVVVHGDHATADVTVAAEGAEQTKSWTFRHDDQRWLVCD